MATKLNTKFLEGFVSDEEIRQIAPQVIAAARTLHAKDGAGNDFLGWLDLPVDYDKEEFERIKKAAATIRKSDVLIVIGIGGSYLGARAVIEAIKSHNYNALPKDTPDIYFAGKSISADELNDLIAICEGKDFCVNVISKSGTTTEPALAFRVFRDMVERKYGKEEAKKRIFVTTDKAKGTLKGLADAEGYETFVVPDDVGGRFSVLTAVGLLPIAAAGIDIDALMQGAAEAREALCDEDLEKNDCYKYAAIRNILYNKGRKVELLASYEPRFDMMCQWYKQLFGESEGKDGKGIFPASVIFSTDLHSLGQYIQESGAALMFETVVNIKQPQKEYYIEDVEGNIDGRNKGVIRMHPLEQIGLPAHKGGDGISHRHHSSPVLPFHPHLQRSRDALIIHLLDAEKGVGKEVFVFFLVLAHELPGRIFVERIDNQLGEIGRRKGRGVGFVETRGAGADESRHVLYAT